MDTYLLTVDGKLYEIEEIKPFIEKKTAAQVEANGREIDQISRDYYGTYAMVGDVHAQNAGSIIETSIVAGKLTIPIKIKLPSRQ